MTKGINSKSGHAVFLSIYPSTVCLPPLHSHVFGTLLLMSLIIVNILKGNSSLDCRILEKEEILKIFYFLNEE